MKKIKLEEMKKIQIEILKYIDTICTENSIDYFLIGGSLIGAIRHNGFIPWDDDIDIAMTKDNYSKLCKVMEKESNNYLLLDHKSNENYHLLFGKMVDKRTILYEGSLKNIPEYGVFVDIFFYSGVPSSKKKQIRHVKKIKNTQRCIWYSYDIGINDNNYIKQLVKKLYQKYIKLIGIERYLKKADKLFNKYNTINSKHVVSNWPIYPIKQEIQLTNNIIKTEYHQFENIKAKIPKNYDEILKTTFGDYMKLPPKEEQIPKHNLEAYWR